MAAPETLPSHPAVLGSRAFRRTSPERPFVFLGARAGAGGMYLRVARCDTIIDMSFPFAAVEEAIEEFRQGRPIVLVDDEDRENEGDLALPAEKVTPEAVNFMAKYGRGLVCLALTEDRCDELNLPPMSPVNTSSFGTAFTESID